VFNLVKDVKVMTCLMGIRLKSYNILGGDFLTDRLSESLSLWRDIVNHD
jgi:hypothetical protein